MRKSGKNAYSDICIELNLKQIQPNSTGSCKGVWLILENLYITYNVTLQCCASSYWLNWENVALISLVWFQQGASCFTSRKAMLLLRENFPKLHIMSKVGFLKDSKNYLTHKK